ncbi:hypothetical protein OEZ85_005314 [Tetradesmus obliquus]|uniref:Dynamin-type G domain-containing protein n=1 Tax=Tetradesmus obliquus TaxID=3088 RepID=A0ABY8UHI4_TETOB|nr:hypothetical protein OEZ85_005314 [Tetradesmus obliquus]
MVPTDSSQQQYSRLAGKMISMVNELRATGADVALELPTIVVCGQQSAGKSSVVEAICGIPLPRNQETCTRCPTEVRLSQLPPASGAAWEATVKLRREGGSSEPSVRASAAWQLQQHLPQQPGQQQQQGGNAQAPSPASSRQPSNASGLLPDGTAVGHDLAALSTEVLFRAGINNPPDLPGAVAAAQAALLTPQGSAGRWSGGGGSDVRRQNSGGNGDSSLAVAGSGGSSGTLKFTRETVVVEVRGAPVDLTLIDLPGIIHSVERPEDEHYKGLVADLARSYMQRPGVVIVATVTCKEDIDTQVILSMAREADSEGSRTLGVLTKPDQVEEGCHGQWLQVLAGERYPLALGWYVVRNPNQAALVRGTSSSMARQQEDAFFNSTHPWRGLPSSSRGRLGTLKLREAMSKQLVKMVTVARPALMAAAQAQLAALRVELAAMPPAAVLGDGHAEMLRLIDDVSMSIQEEVLARSQSKHFYQHLLTNFQQLKSELASSRPCFLLPRGGSAGSNSSSATIAACSSLLAVTCALDDDLAGADEARQQLQLVHGGPGSTSRHDSAPATPAGNGKSSGPGSFNIFNTGGSGSDAGAGAGKPGLGVFIGGVGAGAAAGSQAAVVLAACPHQVLLPADGPEARRGMTLEDVRQLVERHHSVELPGFSPYSAVQDLVARHQRPWPAAVTECAAAAHRQLLQLVMLHVGRTFDRFPRAADHIRELASELLEELHSDTTAAVDSLVAMELSGAFAVCRREFSRASSQHLEGLRTLITAAGSSPAVQAGAAADGAAATDERAAKAGSGSGSMKRRGTTIKQKKDLLEQAMKLMRAAG